MEDWRELMNFILREDKEIFRNSLNSINNGLYLELENIAKKTRQNMLKPALKRSIMNITENKIDSNEIEIDDNSDFVQKKLLNDNCDISKHENISEASPLLKHHSDVDALLLALRKKRELFTDSIEQNDNDSNFEQFIKKQLKILQNKKIGRNNKLFYGNNKSMDNREVQNHPFIYDAKKELKEMKFTPIKIKTNENDRYHHTQSQLWYSIQNKLKMSSSPVNIIRPFSNQKFEGRSKNLSKQIESIDERNCQTSWNKNRKIFAKKNNIKAINLFGWSDSKAKNLKSIPWSVLGSPTIRLKEKPGHLISIKNSLLNVLLIYLS